jgi:hypothetical protein
MATAARLKHAVMELTWIFAMGSATRPAQSHGGGSKGACTISVEMAITYWGDVL